MPAAERHAKWEHWQQALQALLAARLKAAVEEHMIVQKEIEVNLASLCITNPISAAMASSEELLSCLL